MSPQSPQTDEDLDRTDELPRLDVAAYEAGLRQREEDPLSRTDTWIVKALQDADAADEASEDSHRHLHAVAEPTVRVRPLEPTQDVTAEVERILSRIEQLERELETARGQTEQWQARSAELTAERTQQEERAATLAANNARLVEQQQIAYDRLQVLEARLREESELVQRRIAELETTLQSERTSHADLEQTLEQQLAAALADIDALTHDHESLKGQLLVQTELAQTRALEIAHLQSAVAEQHRAASEMARLLASKMAEYELVHGNLERRETALTALEGVRTELADQLETMTQAEKARSRELEQAQAALALAGKSEQALQHALTERHQDIAQRQSQLEQLRNELAQTVQERDAARAAHAEEESRHRAAQGQVDAVTQTRDALRRQLDETSSQFDARIAELEEARRTVAERDATIQDLRAAAQLEVRNAQALRGELETALARIVQLVAERDQLASERDTLTARTIEIEAALTADRARLEEAQAVVSGMRAELARAQHLAEDRGDALQIAQESLEELRASGASMEQELEHASAQVQRLQAQLEEKARELEAHQLELAASRTEVGRQTRAQEDLERALRLRDDLLHTLRQELQTAQDDRGLMAAQLEKARTRTKSLAERIFQKDARIASLRADVAVHSEALAALRRDSKASLDSGAERVLEPIDQDGPSVVLNRKVMTVGRTEENDICVPSKLVSRHHARLLVGPNAVIVEDTGSTNGCHVNDHAVRKHLLREGDILLIGDRKFRLRTRERTVATEPVEVG